MGTALTLTIVTTGAPAWATTDDLEELTGCIINFGAFGWLIHSCEDRSGNLFGADYRDSNGYENFDSDFYDNLNNEEMWRRFQYGVVVAFAFALLSCVFKTAAYGVNRPGSCAFIFSILMSAGCMIGAIVSVYQFNKELDEDNKNANFAFNPGPNTFSFEYEVYACWYIQIIVVLLVGISLLMDVVRLCTYACEPAEESGGKRRQVSARSLELGFYNNPMRR